VAHEKGRVNTSTLYAWENAEREIFDYLTTRLDDLEDVIAYLGEFPRSATLRKSEDGSEYLVDMWEFHIQGGGAQILTRQSEGILQTHDFEGTWRGLFGSRTSAQRAWGLLMDSLPVDRGDTIPGIVRLSVDAAPMLQRTTVQIAADDQRGGEERAWAIEQSLRVVFVNTEQRT
jgi:hypothetical protein